MPCDVTIKASDAAIRRYQETLGRLREQQVEHEGGLRRAFGTLLKETGRKCDWTLIEELPVSGGRVRPDGTLRDSWQLPHGYWEAKDAGDDLEVEIRNKRERGYPFSNIIFEDTQSAVLFQNERRILTADCNDRVGLAELLTRFYRHETPDFSSFEEAVGRFSDEVPQLAQGLQDRIAIARSRNTAYQRAFADFMTLCREALNPNISREAVEEMLIQHLLTERLIRRVFDQENFVRRNVIAVEVEKVIDALTGQHFNRREFLGSLDRFYTAIEKAADRLADFSDKQRFINTVYERFFQGFSVKVADTHGIVYTPQEVVEFMVAATDELLQREFGKKLGDEGVCVIDPCTGTGNFVVQLLRRVARENPGQLDNFYRERLFANEVMLMPYYIASLNIEHEYHQRSGHYDKFGGLSFLDTLDSGRIDLESHKRLSNKNAERIAKQWNAEINVLIGNPPYNVGQLNENDNNKNRSYRHVERRIRHTYARDSRATLRMQLYDAYVKFFRWAIDRLEDRDGVICFISNNSFVEGVAFDGFRRELLKDFTRVYHLDLAGNFRKGKGEGENVFGNVTSVGVGITLALRSAAHGEQRELRYWRVAAGLGGQEKLDALRRFSEGRRGALGSVAWRSLKPDARHTWLRSPHADEFDGFLPLGTKEAKVKSTKEAGTVFSLYCGGIKTNRDAIVYDFNRLALGERMLDFIRDYNAQVDLYRREGPFENVDDFVDYSRIKWDGTLKGHLRKLRDTDFDDSRIRISLYRPFSKRYLYFDPLLINSVYRQTEFFPTPESEQENLLLTVPGPGNRTGFAGFVTDGIGNLDFSFEKVQSFPFYTFDADGIRRQENISDWALRLFRAKYPPLLRVTQRGNLMIQIKVGADWPMFSLMTGTIVDLLPQSGSQCFPLYTYDADGTNR
ncbi:MAG: N-6 DNA methylase, partial [Anaerolineaceae bacterium]|nr:N-6 DNA methylase [Anaerolineaceae bacterium]